MIAITVFVIFHIALKIFIIYIQNAQKVSLGTKILLVLRRENNRSRYYNHATSNSLLGLEERTDAQKDFLGLAIAYYKEGLKRLI